MSFFSILGTAVGPLATRVLAALGVGVVSYTALTSLVSVVTQHVTDNYNAIGSEAAQILNLAGANEVLGILAGALSARVSYQTLKRFAKL